MDSNDDQNSGGEEYDREDDSLSDDDSSSVSSVTYRNWVAIMVESFYSVTRHSQKKLRRQSLVTPH